MWHRYLNDINIEIWDCFGMRHGIVHASFCASCSVVLFSLMRLRKYCIMQKIGPTFKISL